MNSPVNPSMSVLMEADNVYPFPFICFFFCLKEWTYLSLGIIINPKPSV